MATPNNSANTASKKFSFSKGQNNNYKPSDNDRNVYYKLSNNKTFKGWDIFSTIRAGK